LSEKVQWRIGPSLGVLTISGKDAYSPTYVEGTKIDGLPDPESEGRTAASLGLNTGLTWSFSERWFLDLGYRLSGNTGIDFERRYLSNLRITVPEKDFGIVGSQINLIVGWRF
jgi:opacity protein-like surface antigen